MIQPSTLPFGRTGSRSLVMRVVGTLDISGVKRHGDVIPPGG